MRQRSVGPSSASQETPLYACEEFIVVGDMGSCQELGHGQECCSMLAGQHRLVMCMSVFMVHCKAMFGSRNVVYSGSLNSKRRLELTKTGTHCDGLGFIE
jgi:hypothetical protein